MSALSFSFLFLSPRVVLQVHSLQARLIHVRIDLGGGNIGMPEHFLDNAQVGSIAQQMRGERMP
jgi:hypothetical protein